MAIGGMVLAAGLAAFQLFESWQAKQLSIRSSLSYELFSQMSYDFLGVWKSFLVPIFKFIETTAYVLPLAAILALAAATASIVAAFRGLRLDPEVFFWLLVAVVAFLLMTGSHTPLNRLVYHIPIINDFRAPSRHTFEWSFAVSVLAAYGWDAVSRFIKFKQPSLFQSRISESARLVFCAALLILIVVVGAWWINSTVKPVSRINTDQMGAIRNFLFFKGGQTVLTLIALWACRQVRTQSRQTGLLTGLLVIVGFVEPYINHTRWWAPERIPASRLTTISPTSRFLQNFKPAENRVYGRVSLFEEAHSPRPILDSPNLTALVGLHNVAGYEPLILRRYSRALGDVWLDGVTSISGAEPDLSLFNPGSHVLDLLNTRFVFGYSSMATSRILKDGVTFDGNDFIGDIARGPRTILGGIGEGGDTLFFITTLTNSGGVTDGTPVARVIFYSSDGRVITRELRAGIDTANEAHERADVRPIIRHSLAQIFDSKPGDARGTFRALRFGSRISLGDQMAVDRVEIIRLPVKADLTVLKGTLYNSQTRTSTILAPADWLRPIKDSGRWQLVYHEDGAVILKNGRALPRAWLVGKAEAVDEEEALRRIRGESERALDPQTTVMLEIDPSELDHQFNETTAGNGRARVSIYEPNRLMIETESDRQSVLVVSEINYPGWIARIDGEQRPIYQADYLLRGVILPAGPHRVEMRYTATAARSGGMVSILALLILIVAIAKLRKNETVKPLSLCRQLAT